MCQKLIGNIKHMKRYDIFSRVVTAFLQGWKSLYNTLVYMINNVIFVFEFELRAKTAVLMSWIMELYLLYYEMNYLENEICNNVKCARKTCLPPGQYFNLSPSYNLSVLHETVN